MTIEALDGRFAVRNRAELTGGILGALPTIGRGGLVVLGIGWVLLLAEPVLASVIPGGSGGLLVRLGQSAIMTGAALAILGLVLSASRQSQPSSSEQGWMEPEVAPVMRVAVQPEPQPSAAPVKVEAPKFEATPASEPAPTREPDRNSFMPLETSGLGGMVVVARGQVDDRCFLVLSDGTIVIETLLGQRRFKTLIDARDFIGGGTFMLHDTVNIPLRASGQGVARPAGEGAVGAGRVLRHV